MVQFLITFRKIVKDFFVCTIRLASNMGRHYIPGGASRFLEKPSSLSLPFKSGEDKA